MFVTWCLESFGLQILMCASSGLQVIQQEMWPCPLWAVLNILRSRKGYIFFFY